MKRSLASLLAALLLSMWVVFAVAAQEDALSLGLSRDWGYGGLGGDIQGTFSMHAGGPSTLVRVDFYIDDTKIGEVAKAPFTLQFVTDNYPLGTHSLYAVGYTSDGQQLPSRKISVNFVSASAGTQTAVRIVVPILVIVLGAMLLAAVVPALLGRKTVSLAPGAPRRYTLGGAICPKCGRPFAIHLFGINLLAGKLDRCPYCGKWSLVRYASIDQLRAAEQAEARSAQGQMPDASAEDKLKKELDESKYQDF